MSPKTVLFALLLFTVQDSLNGNVLNSLESQRTTPKIHQKLGKILNSCYASNLNTLVASEDLGEVTQAVSQHTLVNVYLINENFDWKQRHGFYPRWPTFLLNANSETALTTTLQQLKSSDFWKASSTFFIVGSSEGVCDNASHILHAMWKMDLLTSFYFCEQSEDELLLYTFNPFTNVAPRPWTKVETDLDNRWTLYNQLYLEDIEICKNLKYDKTKSLDGYKIKVLAGTQFGVQPRRVRDDNIEVFRKTGYRADTLTLIAIWTMMKVKPTITYTNLRRPENGRPIGIEAGITNGTNDMAGLSRYKRPSFSSFTYPFVMSKVAILTKHRSFLNPVEKIINFYSLGAVLLIGAAFSITWIIFIIENNSISSAALEVLRLVLSTSVLHPLRRIPLRIYLFGIWWLVIILNATFQGQISSFLTKPERHDVETLEDLKRYNYHIYVNSFYQKLLSDWLREFPEDRIHVIDEDDCYENVINDSSAACIQNIGELYEVEQMHNFHVSRPLSFSPYLTFPHRTDWPLAEKVNTYMSRLAASGSLDHWSKLVDAEPRKKIHAKEAQDTAPQVRPIRLKDLTFAFALLAIGITIAGMCLIGEIRIGAKTKVNKIRVDQSSF